MSTILAKQDLFLNAAKDTAVKQCIEAKFLIARKGRPIPVAYQHLVTAGGDVKTDKKPVVKKPVKKAAKKPADKAAKKPSNK